MICLLVFFCICVSFKGVDVLRVEKRAGRAPGGVDQAQRVSRLRDVVPARGARRQRVSAQEVVRDNKSEGEKRGEEPNTVVNDVREPPH